MLPSSHYCISFPWYQISNQDSFWIEWKNHKYGNNTITQKPIRSPCNKVSHNLETNYLRLVPHYVILYCFSGDCSNLLGLSFSLLLSLCFIPYATELHFLPPNHCHYSHISNQIPFFFSLPFLQKLYMTLVVPFRLTTHNIFFLFLFVII